MRGAEGSNFALWFEGNRVVKKNRGARMGHKKSGSTNRALVIGRWCCVMGREKYRVQLTEYRVQLPSGWLFIRRSFISFAVPCLLTTRLLVY